jgi:hypothetical protein
VTDDLIERLRGYGDGNNDLMDAAADRIEELEKEIVKIGGIIDSYPSAALQWQSTTPMPPQFRIMLHNDWWNTAIKTLKETSYIALKYPEQIEEKQND